MGVVLQRLSAAGGPRGSVPGYNVSVPLIGKDFWIFELTGVREAAPPVH